MQPTIDVPSTPLLLTCPVRHAEHLAGFLPLSLRRLLAGKFEAHLVGSWATNEAHLPYPVEGRIFSLSDVDVLVDAPPTAAKSAEIKRAVLTLAAQHGVEISKVSVRYRSEIEAFWDPSRIDAFADSRPESGRFLVFWALIGAVEALSPSAHSTEHERAYAVVKFFFKLCRNVLLIRRRTPASYRQLTSDVLNRLLPHPGVRHAYAIKIGHEQTLSHVTCEALLSDSNWEPLTGTLIDARSSVLLASLRGDICAWYRTGASPGVESYLSHIRTFRESPELMPACLKAIHDHERRRNSASA